MRPLPGLPVIRRPRRAIVTLLAMTMGPAIGLALAPSRPADAATVATAATVLSPASTTGITGWTQTGSYLESSLTADEGVATVTPASGSPYELYRGVASIPASVLADGWTHVGDLDSADGYIIDATPSHCWRSSCPPR
jgi:hypothetical protein